MIRDFSFTDHDPARHKNDHFKAMPHDSKTTKICK